MIARRRSPIRPKSPPSSTNGYARTAVLLEELRAQNNVVLESVVAHRQETDRNLAELRADMNTGLGILEAGIRHLSRRADAMDKRFDAVDARFDAVDARFDAVHGRLDAVDGRFDRVDKDLASLRQEGREFADLVARKADGASLVALEHRVGVLERGVRV